MELSWGDQKEPSWVYKLQRHGQDTTKGAVGGETLLREEPYFCELVPRFGRKQRGWLHPVAYRIEGLEEG